MASEATVKEWEDKAARQKRLNKAEAEYIVNDTSVARSQAKEQAENNRQRDIASSAHERFMQSRRQYIERNKFAVSPFEFAATMGYKRGEQNPADLRAHELKMVDKKNEGAIKVAEHNANGMINQGKSAAEINAGVKTKEIEAGVKKHEREMQNRKDLATIQADAQKSIAEGQNNTTLKNTKLQGENAVKKQSEANKGWLAQSELKEKMEKEKLDNSLQTAIIKANAGLNAQQAKNQATIIGNAIRAGAQSGKDIATVFTELKEIYKNDETMMKSLGGIGGGNGGDSGGVTKFKAKEGDVLTTPSGKKAVFRSGKWVIEG